MARQDIVKDGFRPSTAQLMVLTAPPTPDQERSIRANCIRLQEEMYEFGHVQPKVFGGTVRDLINAYQTDKDSAYQTMRYRGRVDIDNSLKRIDAKYGKLKLADLGARDFKHWYEGLRWPDGVGGRETRTMAHSIMTAVRMMFTFGKLYKVDPACARLKEELSEIQFSKGSKRTEVLTLRQCEDIMAVAHADGVHSLALAQAIQRNLGLRQRDVIGEWVPVAEPGVSDVMHHGLKWLRGIRWEEISSDFILEHRMSKSRAGKVLKFDLKQYPMVMTELLKIPEADRVGALVKSENTGRPWKQSNFLQRWRQLAIKAGVPKTVRNMDSRAGAITEVIRATGDVDAARIMAGHSETKTTLGYSREDLERNNETAVIVADFRAKNRA